MHDPHPAPEPRLPLRWDAPIALPLWWLLTGYRRWISPLLPPACRFEPSCSAYARDALSRYGIHRALPLIAWRLLRCQPLSKGGADPVPVWTLAAFALGVVLALPAQAAPCATAAAPVKLRNPKLEVEVSPCGAGLKAVRLLDAQFRMPARPVPAKAPAGKFAAGPLDLVETWDPFCDPFRDELMQPTAAEQLEFRDGATVQTRQQSLVDLYRDDPTWAVRGSSASEVTLVWPDPARVHSPLYLAKRWQLLRDNQLRVDLQVWNVGASPRTVQLVHSVTALQDRAALNGGGFMAMFAGPPDNKSANVALSGEVVRVEATALLKAASAPDPEHTRAGLPDWLGVDSRYFLLASVPTQGYTAQARTRLLLLRDKADTAAVVQARLEPTAVQVPAGSCVPAWVAEQWRGQPCAPDVKAANVVSLGYEVFAGPKDLDALQAAGHNLGQAVDFGWFGVIGRPMLWVLKQAHDLTTSWPAAILMLTLLVKLLLWPITARSTQSMRAMQALKPELDKLRAELEEKARKLGKEKADPTELNQRTMELYSKHGVNPLGGCLPMLLQLPVYISLYKTIQSSVGLYNQPLFGWIGDMTQKDPLYVLPLVLGGVMFAQQKLTPQPGGQADQQKFMLYFMPILFTAMMLQLPSGLVLYILANTVLGIAQTLYINRTAPAPGGK
jgi:putative membrane protein insertion efficiency factor